MDRSRYDTVGCVVTKHVHYGVLVELDAGERGWIADDCINEERSIDPRSWPPVGSDSQR